METLSTNDYDMFKSITSNREVDERHVKRLADAIGKKNLLHINPIVCNEQFEVIDGQHRLEAARRLGVPVYYLTDGQVTKGDIAAINSNAKNWSVMDYINYWTIEKKPGFDRLSAFLSDHPMIPTSTAMLMLSSDCKRDTAGLKNGFVDISNYETALTIAGILKEYRNLIDHAYDRNFVLAVMHVAAVPGYNHDIMRTKLEFQSRSLVKCVSKKQYIEMLEEIYNYKSSTNRLRFL